MGELTERLRKGFQSSTGQKIVSLDAVRRGQELARELPTLDELIAADHHPLHAVYKTMANLLSLFVDDAVLLPFFSGVEKFFYEAEDRYRPVGPGFTPILLTIYNHWIFFDVRFKKWAGNDR